MTVEEAAKHFGVSESYIRSHMRKGDFSSNMQGFPILLKKSDVDVFLLPFKLD